MKTENLKELPVTNPEVAGFKVLQRWQCDKDQVLCLVVCTCGKNWYVRESNLKSGNSKSCGCKKPLPRKRKHGGAVTGKRMPEYRSWEKMIERCEKAHHHAYHLYGGRGIKVCKRWRDSFQHFLEDVGLRPTLNHSLDRINVDGDYEPGNVRWATDLEQSRNTRWNRKITYEGVTLCISEWAEKLGIPYGTIHTRLKKGLPLELCFSKQKLKRKSVKKKK